MNVLIGILLTVLSVALFAFAAVGDAMSQNTERTNGITFSVHDVEKDLTPGGWAVVIGAVLLAGYGIFRFVKRPRIK